MTASGHGAYERARDAFGAMGADAEAALRSLAATPLSLPCWGLDDVRGFEAPERGPSDGGIRVTGTLPGRARNVEELRADLQATLALVPGDHRVNLHAMYGEFGGRRVDRDALEPAHFAGWADWAHECGVDLDFNATFFSHPRAAGGLTLSHPDAGVRAFWIEHGRRARAVAAGLGATRENSCVHNLWIPDGTKDVTVDRAGTRLRLRDSLDAVYAEEYDAEDLLDAVESKLFGIGAESFTAGSYDFLLAYALGRRLAPCLDLGHFHPTESVADKISALLPFVPEILLHLSRGVRWDSDHVVVLDDAIRETASEVVRAGALGRVRIALDFFDATVPRVGALVAGARAVQKSLLLALLEPRDPWLALEREGRRFELLATVEEWKTLDAGAVWDEFCRRQGAPSGPAWIREALAHQARVEMRG